MYLLIKNIKKLIQTETEIRQKVEAKDMSYLNNIDDAYLLIKDDLIIDFGPMSKINHKIKETAFPLKEIDATGKMVLPSWCDSHTHLVFAGSRESEFVDRIKGLSYEEIAQKGGGILNSAKRLHDTSEEELLQGALNRLNEIMLMGTGAVEIKSGYGLSVEDEIKILRVIKKLKGLSPLTIKSTFLGAHAFPTEFKTNRSAYIDLIINKMLPIIQEEELADCIDIFCESNYFSVAEMKQIMVAGEKIGLKPKIHVNQFNSIGGIQAAVKQNALSVDHLEVLSEEDFETLKGSSTMPTLLPSCSFFIGIPYAPARKLIDAGIPVALASDFNPGSTPSGKMSFVVSLACIKMKMTPEEAINAATINSAYAMDLSHELGSIAIGKKANLFITTPIPSYEYIPYAFGSNLVETIILNGKVQRI